MGRELGAEERKPLCPGSWPCHLLQALGEWGFQKGLQVPRISLSLGCICCLHIMSGPRHRRQLYASPKTLLLLSDQPAQDVPRGTSTPHVWQPRPSPTPFPTTAHGCVVWSQDSDPVGSSTGSSALCQTLRNLWETFCLSFLICKMGL